MPTVSEKYLELQTIEALNKYKVDDEFLKPLHSNAYYKNLDTLLENSQYTDFKKTQWYRNPQQFCLDTYGDVNFTRVILLVNLMGTHLEFHPNYINRIVTPTYKSMLDTRLI